ncbi:MULTISPECIES: type II toxin-antitoxin system RelE/ParE family toxin [unclassified Aureimonas]|uniref:type II toxin-antitoxin system RelE/ParE family toxin n=1 Tax=Aureimonas sp. Leaf427 TaxID=1736375 RepID=UPI0009EC4937
MKRVRLSSSASAYLRREAAYLRRHAPASADAFLIRMQSARDRLSEFPESGPPSDGNESAGFRQLVVGDYVFAYRIVGDEVRILFIRHGRQDRRPPERTA